MNNWVALQLSIICLLMLPVFAGAQSSVVQATVSWNQETPSFVVLKSTVEAPDALPIRLHLPIEEQERYQYLFDRYAKDHWQVTFIDVDGRLELQSAYRITAVEQNELTSTPDLLSVIQEGPYRADNKSRSANFDVEQQQVVYLTNLARHTEGLTPLKQVNLLHNSADGHSDRMATRDFFAHCDIHSKKDPFERMQDAGYNWNLAGENIAAGQTSAEEVMNGDFGWMNSPGHRANILKPTFREIGVGFEIGADDNKDEYDQNGDCNGDGSGGPFRRYWTQNFGARNNVYPLIINREQALVEDPNVELYIYAPSDAAEMRFKNENEEWSEWIGYQPTYSWQLSTTSGSKTVFSEVRTFADQVYKGVDNIDLEFDCDKVNIANQTISDNRSVQACEVTVGGNLTLYGSLTIDAQETTLQGESQIMQGSTLEIRPAKN